MAGIRKQTIQSSIIVYLGFLVGVINTYFYTRNCSFTTQEYGVTRIFIDFAQNFFAFASLGTIPVLYKFYPYYKDNLPDKKNDLLTLVLAASMIGFLLVASVSVVFQPFVVRKFGEHSALFLQFYYWLFPFSLGYLLFAVFESFSWSLHKSVVSNSLKETVLRLITSVFILLFLFKLVNFTQFMYLFSLLYLIIAILLAIYLYNTGHLKFTFTISRVTKKFYKKMLGLQFFVFGGICLNAVAITISGILIASKMGLAATGIYSLAAYTANFIEVPQRSIISISTGVLSRAWKDKNFAQINHVYHRSSINMLLLSIFIFGNVWLNVAQGISVLHVQDAYLAGLSVVFILGIAKIIDAGTGVNSVIIITSTFWKFEFWSGIVLLSLRIPLAYILIQRYGIIGPAYAELISQVVYNFIRYEFLRRRFKMQPFNLETLYTVLLGVAATAATYFLFYGINGWLGIILRSALFSGILIGGIFLLKLTPDAMQLVDVAKSRIRNWKK
ncbi:MAG TPA: polysaccharide biosynthesis C-terminal domain-containing protein [Parafilimonas sp.]|nr:polysaccharide biosynthesis C-terminal domain-containing protein [Parafilimonas sp.]